MKLCLKIIIEKISIIKSLKENAAESVFGIISGKSHKNVPSAQGISRNWHLQIILIFSVVNSKYDSKIQLLTAIFKSAEHKMFEICARDSHKTLE